MRQPQRVWKTFYRLKLRANFFIGSKEYQKEGFCWYRQINKAVHTAEEWGKRTPVQFIAPWTVVRSDEYVNKKLIAAKVRTRSGDGHTHYVGDGCTPAHSDGPTGPIGGPGCAGIPGPNQDNNITGPTS